MPKQQFVGFTLSDIKRVHINIEPFSRQDWVFDCAEQLSEQTGFLLVNCTERGIDLNKYQDLLKNYRVNNKSIISIGHFSAQFKRQLPELKNPNAVDEKTVYFATEEMIKRGYVFPDINFFAYTPQQFKYRERNPYQLVIEQIYDELKLPWMPGDNAVTFTRSRHHRREEQIPLTTGFLTRKIDNSVVVRSRQ